MFMLTLTTPSSSIGLVPVGTNISEFYTKIFAFAVYLSGIIWIEYEFARGQQRQWGLSYANGVRLLKVWRPLWMGQKHTWCQIHVMLFLIKVECRCKCSKWNVMPDAMKKIGRVGFWSNPFPIYSWSGQSPIHQQQKTSQECETAGTSQ